MKKGMILYVMEGQEEVPLQGSEDLIEVARSLGVTAISVATSEEDVVHGWWHLVNGGARQVLFMTVAYNGDSRKFESRGVPVRLCEGGRAEQPSMKCC